MPDHPINKLRSAIAAKVRKLRTDRRWTQARLAGLLGLSQNRLSEIERGEGSFTAEQLILILKNFNVPIDHFAPSKALADLELQNALARLGAAHLHESADVLPTGDAKDVAKVVRETLTGAQSPRNITALAPVIVAHIKGLNLYKLKGELSIAGFERALWWVLENTLEAVRREQQRPLSRRWKFLYGRAQLHLENFLPSWTHDRNILAKDWPEDIFDPDIASPKTVEEVRAESSKISRDWKIVTRIQVEDFEQALRDARGTD